MEKWAADGEFVHAAYTLREDDDDWGQPGTPVREVLDDAARDRLVSNVVGHLSKGVSEPVLTRAFEYWRNIDKQIGDRIANGINGHWATGPRELRSPQTNIGEAPACRRRRARPTLS